MTPNEQVQLGEFYRAKERPKLPPHIGSIILLTGESMESTNVGHENDGDSERRFSSAVQLFFDLKKEPAFVINGSDEQNAVLKEMAIDKGVREAKIFTLPNPPHSSTLIQIKEIKKKNPAKPYVFVSDPFHIPRVRRYVKKWLPESLSFFWPTNHPLNDRDIELEIAKIIKYSKRGDLEL